MRSNIVYCCPFDRQAAKTMTISLVLEPSSFCVKIKSQSLQNILLKQFIFLMDNENMNNSYLDALPGLLCSEVDVVIF